MTDRGQCDSCGRRCLRLDDFLLTIPVNKPFLQLIGESVAGVIITYDNYSGKLIPGGGGATYGTNNCATLFVNAADCAVESKYLAGIRANQPGLLLPR